MAIDAQAERDGHGDRTSTRRPSCHGRGLGQRSTENRNRNAVGTYSAADPERDTLTWSVTGSDASDFWISQRGQLYFRSPPSFEGRSTYSVTITAEDEGGLRDSLTVTVAVTDIEEAGVVTILPPRGWVGTGFTATLLDGDGSTGFVDWQWERSSNGSSWTIITGGTSRSYTATADDIDMNLRVTASYENSSLDDREAEAVLAGRIGDSADRPAQNNAPAFTDTPPVTRSVGQGTSAGRPIGAPCVRPMRTRATCSRTR